MGDVGQEAEPPAEENGPAEEAPVMEQEGGQAAQLEAAAAGGEEPVQEERERTLTDHLNKKLLESFLNRLDMGDMKFPPGMEGAKEEEEWNDS